MTDAAGSVTLADARRWDMTLLSSYITLEGLSLPETLLSPENLYETMRLGGRVTTSQASMFERGQCCQSVLSRYRQVLYLCVGSVYTGNYDAVVSWKRKNDSEGQAARHRYRRCFGSTGHRRAGHGCFCLPRSRYRAGSAVCKNRRGSKP